MTILTPGLDYYAIGQRVCAHVTFDGSGYTLLLDGNKIASSDIHTTGLSGNVTPWLFGSVLDTPSVFDGVIDEIAIWNRVLTRNEMYQLTQAELVL
jgi:hypothetical protein